MKKLGNKEFKEFHTYLLKVEHKKAYNLFKLWEKEYGVPEFKIESENDYIYINEDGITMEANKHLEFEFKWRDVVCFEDTENS